MNQYIKRLARRVLKDEIDNLLTDIEMSRDATNILSGEKEKLQKRLKRYDRPENILLSYYRIDNIDSNGMPPSYLRPNNPSEYTQRIHELESVYRNTAFREMMAWALNFHANILASGKIRNDYGDEVDIKSEDVKNMISGIKSIWELVLAAHTKDNELTANKTGGLQDLISEEAEEIA